MFFLEVDQWMRRDSMWMSFDTASPLDWFKTCSSDSDVQTHYFEYFCSSSYKTDCWVPPTTWEIFQCNKESLILPDSSIITVNTTNLANNHKLCSKTKALLPLMGHLWPYTSRILLECLFLRKYFLFSGLVRVKAMSVFKHGKEKIQRSRMGKKKISNSVCGFRYIRSKIQC